MPDARAGHSGSTGDGPCCEALEARMLLSAELLGNGILDVKGSNDDDIVIIQQGAMPGSVVLFGVEGVTDGTVFQDVKRLRVKLRLGDDVARLDGTPLTPSGEFMPIRMLGQGGADQLEIVTADGILIGGAGNDILFGGPGENRIKGLAGQDVIAGGGGDDTLLGGRGNDRIFGEGGNDTIRGAGGQDFLRGGTGRDRIFGGSGIDDIFGGRGPDTMTGGTGADLFRGEFGEWTDFGPGDEFFQDEFLTDPEAVTLPDSFWIDMNTVDMDEGFNLSDDVWTVVTGVQQIASEASAEIALFHAAADALDQADQVQLGDDIINTILAFSFSFADPSDITDAEVGDLLDQLRGVMPTDVSSEFDAIADAILADTQTRVRTKLALRALNTIGNGNAPADFLQALRDLLPG